MNHPVVGTEAYDEWLAGARSADGELLVGADFADWLAAHERDDGTRVPIRTEPLR